MPDPSPRPEADDAVRRLLAQARHDEPIPDDVARRLDRTLDELRAEATPDDEPDAAQERVASLARAARRRTATRLLVAAAAVLVVGVGIGEGLGRLEPTGSGSDSGGSSASQSLPRDTPGPEDGAAGAAPGTGGGLAPQDSAGSGYAQLARALPLVLTSADFDADARAAVTRAARLDPALQDDSPLAEALARPLPGWTCGTGTSTDRYGAGVLLPATYDGTPVVLALRPAAGDRIPVRVLACGTARVLRGTVLDAS